MRSTSLDTSLKILVVENHTVTREAMEMWLVAMGHEVRTATNVQEGLTAFSASPVDVLISDISLPDGTGWDLLQQIELPEHSCAIAMSGLGTPELESRSREVGFRHCLQKPFEPEQLVAYLEEAQVERSKVA